MKNKLRFLMRNKQSFIALFILLAIVFNACQNPVGSPRGNPEGNPEGSNTSDFTPTYFYVDTSGKLTETDSGRTVLVTDDKAEVVFYSDNIQSSDDDHIGLTFEGKTIIFFFEKDRNFPNRIVLSDSEEPYYGFFTPYDPEIQTYCLTLEHGDEKEVLSNITLSKEIFSQYKDDTELTPSQNLRMRNLYIATCIYKSLDDFIASGGTLRARGLWDVFDYIGRTYFPAKYTQKIAHTSKLIGDFITLIPIVGYIDSGLDILVDSIVVITDITGGTGPVSVTLDSTSINLDVGSTAILTPIMDPVNARYESLNWRSSDESVATVSEQGVVTGVAAGTAAITVTTFVNNRKATCTVTVNSVSPFGVTLDKTSVSLIVGGTETITSTIVPANATNKNVSWDSSDESVATVSNKGLVIGVGAGMAAITVTTDDGNKTAACIVKVNSVPVTGVTLDKTSVSLFVGDTETLTPIITPATETNKSVSWSSNNKTVATVSAQGVITGVAAGTATITVTTVDGKKTAECQVNVVTDVVPVTGVTLNKTSVSFVVDETVTLIPTITPSNAINKTVNWSSNNTAVATVSDQGVVTSVAAGMAIITVTTVDGNKTATCIVNVNPVSPTGVSLDKTSIGLVVGDTEALTPTITPFNAANKTVNWSSNNTAVATVSDQGVVKGVAAGSAVITVTTVDGNKTAVCQVNVVTDVVPVTNVTLINKPIFNIIVGDTVPLTAIITPSNATNKNVAWASSNVTVATVSYSGMVTGMSVGTAIIKVTTVDGIKTDTCIVNVNPVSPTGVSLNKTSISLVIGGTETLTPTITPSNATNQNVKWSSSKSTVATVSNNGTVTAVAPGEATIVVTAVDTTNNVKTAECKVTVMATSVGPTLLVTGLNLNKKYGDTRYVNNSFNIPELKKAGYTTFRITLSCRITRKTVLASSSGGFLGQIFSSDGIEIGHLERNPDHYNKAETFSIDIWRPIDSRLNSLTVKLSVPNGGNSGTDYLVDDVKITIEATK